METTASWRLLSPASSSPPPSPAPPKRHAAFAASPQRKASSKFRLHCLLHHDKPAAAAAGTTSQLQRLTAALQWGAVWAAVEAPAAMAVTGEEDIDILGILPPVAAFAFVYFFVVPPLLMNWMRLRWYKRKFVETYLQFMFTYIFYPATAEAQKAQLLPSQPIGTKYFGGLMIWAPFVNFRKFPRDPTMEYPWSKPKAGTPLFKDRYPPIDSYKS
ncbi:hypothetical protein ACP4OV_024036 [Aristida adscensionis]